MCTSIEVLRVLSRYGRKTRNTGITSNLLSHALKG